MGKRVLIISTSLRKGGNSEILADECIKGVRQAGHEVEKISLQDKEINFCKGCLACKNTKRCVMHDDADMIVQKMLSADAIVFATPIYYYEMSGQMKTLLDRANPLYFSDYRFRDVYLLATSADEDESAMDGAVKGLQGWISCFEKARLVGVVRCTDTDAIGAVQNAARALETAYEMGKNV